MGEEQEQGYICKICKKSCVSGKSLGGHMRVHLSLISASKKAAKGEFEGKMGFEDCDNQCNSTFLSEEKIKNCEGDKGFGDFDFHLNNSYELRDNPKKSRRICNPKHGVTKKRNSCKECGKEFTSLRALSAHVRSHSIKNGEVHNCKKCGKGFGSMRAMFGHMKSHSKKLRVHDSGDGLSDFENLCPVRRKRSRIKYDVSPDGYGCGLNVSNGGVAEVREVKEAAACLMMLSRGVRDWNGISLVTEFSDDDDVYFGGESSCKSEKIDRKDGGFVCVSDKISKLDSCISISEIAKVNDVDDLDISFAAENEMKVDVEVSDEGLLYVDMFKDLLKPNKSKLSHDSGFGRNSSENVAHDLEILKGLEMEQESEGVSIMTSLDRSSRSKEHECPICLKVFPSGPALGGHKRAHRNEGAENITNTTMTVNQERGEIDNGFDLNFPISVDEGTTGDLGANLLWVETRLDREAVVLTTN